MKRKSYLLNVWTTVMVLLLLSSNLSAQRAKPDLYFGVNADSFSASGRWIPSDPKDKTAYSSESQIDCYKQLSMCVEATAEYYYGHPHVSLTYFEIVRWDENGIISTSANGIMHDCNDAHFFFRENHHEHTCGEEVDC